MFPDGVVLKSNMKNQSESSHKYTDAEQGSRKAHC